MKKIPILLIISVSVLFVNSGSLSYGGDTPNGKPFEYLRSQIETLGGETSVLEERLSVAEDALEHNGKKVGPGLYEVHTRVLWDVGWLTNSGLLDSNGFFTYNEFPRSLVYAVNRTTFLRPLKSYGIPDIPDGATRKVRLYVNYGHQWMCDGTPTVSIGDVEFYLDEISGYYGDMGAGWSNFREYEEYEFLGHAQIQVYLRDFQYGGPHCGPYPGIGRPKGVIYRIEAHFYDEFPLE